MLYTKSGAIGTRGRGGWVGGRMDVVGKEEQVSSPQFLAFGSLVSNYPTLIVIAPSSHQQSAHIFTTTAPIYMFMVPYCRHHVALCNDIFTLASNIQKKHSKYGFIMMLSLPHNKDPAISLQVLHQSVYMIHHIVDIL